MVYAHNNFLHFLHIDTPYADKVAKSLDCHYSLRANSAKGDIKTSSIKTEHCVTEGESYGTLLFSLRLY